MIVLSSNQFPAQYNTLTTSEHQYRNSRTGARSTRTQIDHDVFEGLPVRHWRKRSFNVNAAPEKDNLDLLGTGDTGWPELPMPRDAHMYSPMSEALLRAARMGQVKKPATPLMDDDKEPGEDEDADRTFDMGFIAKRWAVLPKDMEGPEPEFLAKRRKGLPSIYTGASGPLGNTAQMWKTKIRKVDTEGNSYIWEVLVPEGQAVDGEIVEEETSPTQAPAPGTVVEGLGVVNAEGVVIAGDQAMPAGNRRRPPPPKRKAKGPGRGRKKKVAFMPGTEGAATANGVSAVLNGSSAGADDGRSAKIEHGVADGDTEMGDENTLQEGEEGSEEGSEGEEGEDGDREEGELSPSPTPAKSSEEPPTIVVHDVKVEAPETERIPIPLPSKVALSSTLEPASPAEPTRDDSSDPMLLDEDGDEPISNALSEPTMTSISQSTDPIADVAAHVAVEASEETTLTTETILRPSEVVVEKRLAASIAEPETEPQTKAMMTPLRDTNFEPLPEPVEQPVSETTATVTDQRTKNLAESFVRHGIEPTLDVSTEGDVSAESATGTTAGSTAEAVAGLRPGASADLAEEAVLDARTDMGAIVIEKTMPTSSMGVAPETASSDMVTSTTKATVAPSEEPELEPPTKSIPESNEETKPVEVPLPLAEKALAEQSIADVPISGAPIVEDLMPEHSTSEQPASEQPASEQPASEQLVLQQPVLVQLSPEQPPTPEQPMLERQHMHEQSIPEQFIPEQHVREHPMLEQQPLPEQSTVPEQQLIPEPPAMPEQPTVLEQRIIPEPPPMPKEPTVLEQQLIPELPPMPEQQPMLEQSTSERPSSERLSPEQPMPEPWARSTTESVPEAVSPERRFSYTRVTTSPQAPTPSPPTPIESSFGLKAPYLSPKAPTMSPPTPIERTVSSSPEIPLADQHFRLPPQIDAAEEADQAPAPDMPHIPVADRMSVEAAPDGNGVNAQIPIEHNPLDGMAEPRATEGSEGSTQHFTDGEEDLLGSLERSLGKHRGRP